MHTKSDTIAELAKALAAAQSEIENAHKTANNPHFRSKYADLAEVINTARPVLSKHGLSVTQWPSYVDGVASVETILTHTSGEWIANTASAPADKLTAQGIGSATTYLRRYSLAALACIAQEDDDGNDASKRPQNDDAPADQDVIDTEAAIALEQRVKEVGADHGALLKYFGVENVKQMTKAQAKAAHAMLDKKAKAQEAA